jgi:hypothetical protein
MIYGVDLYWLPLGAGGHFVRLNGRVYEACDAAIHHVAAGTTSTTPRLECAWRAVAL